MAEWRRGDIFRLIELFKERRLLWDPFQEDYKNRIRKHDSWRELDEQLCVKEGECEKKMRKLIGQFQRERKKATASGQSPNDGGKWVYFKSLMFLKDKHRPRSTLKLEITDNLESLDENFEKVMDQPADFRPPPPKVLKREQKSAELQLIAAAEKLVNSSETKLMDSWEAFGLSVGGDLRNLENKQQTIAQKLISDVIFLAKMGRLSEGTLVAGPLTHFITSNICPTPPLSNTSVSLSPYNEENNLP